MKPNEEQIKELERQVEELKQRVSVLEKWIATHHSKPLPPNIERVIGKPLPKKGEPFIPEVLGNI